MTKIANLKSLFELFLGSLRAHPGNVALVVESKSYTYCELAYLAQEVAIALNETNAGSRVGVFANRTVAAYAGVIGILMSGRTYVPMNPKFPGARNESIATSAGLSEIVCDSRDLEQVALLDHGKITPIEVTDTQIENLADLDTARDLLMLDSTDVMGGKQTTREDLAYIMFTSGTTGVPKGVPITNGNVLFYVENILNLAQLKDTDRFSQTFDLTFDLSVHDMFVCWAVGASLHVLPERMVMAPAKFIKDQELTVWFSVPSTIGFMQKLRMLDPNSFDSLRHSWFCGEALPAESARRWQAAAPNSTIENLYGPTEATIAFTVYRWCGNEDDARLSGGYVPIGKPMGNLETVIIDDDRSPVAENTAGELCLGGNQLSPGYWRDDEKTAAVFFERVYEGLTNQRWYRSGDLAQINEHGDIEFIGRVDSQVKILGYRVELGEVERVIRQAAETDLAAAVAWPREGSGASGIVAFICGGVEDVNKIIEQCKTALPPYMVPKTLRRMESFPMNANGKVDRRALEKMLEEGKTHE